VPFYRYESLLRELVLGSAGLFLAEEAGFRLGDAVRVLLEPEVVRVGGEVGRACAGVLDDGEVSGQKESAVDLDKKLG